MRTGANSKFQLATVLSLAFLWPVTGQRAEAELRVTLKPAGALVLDGDQRVLYYQRRPKSLDGRFQRCNYVHPLYDLDGQVLTEDFPDDHRHHRGVFWAWHQLWVGDLRAGDPWVIRDILWDVEDLQAQQAPNDAVALEASVVWKSPNGSDARGLPTPLLREATRITVHPRSDTTRMIDFDIRLLALRPDLRLGGSEDAKGYGGFSVRVRLPQDVRFTSQSGDVQPQREAIQAGAIMDVSGTYSARGDVSGLAILCHPANPGFPQPWILRRQRSMQNAVYPGRTPVALAVKTPLRLRYRLIVHRGAADVEQLSQWQRQYAAVEGGRDHSVDTATP